MIDSDEVIPEKLATAYRSVIAFGRARVLEDEEEIVDACTMLGLKYCDDRALVQSDIERELKALAIIEISIEHMTGKIGSVYNQG